jgi:4-hydroxy-2-oxoheptanedioate aldolase
MTPPPTRFNSLKQKWANGAITTSTIIAMPAGIAAELVCHQGWDSVTIDVQHGLVDYQVAAHLIQAMGSSHVPVLVRVGSNDPSGIMKMLDAGALGVICPAVESVAAARQFVGACRYPPAGYRSFGPFRAALRFGPSYVAEASDNVAAVAMIETQAGVQALEDILAVPGIDMVFVGPTDLSLSMGFPGVFDPPFPEVRTTIKQIAAAAGARGIIAGIYVGTTEVAREMLALGYRHIAFSSDLRLLTAASAGARSELQNVIAQFERDTQSR